MFTKPTHTPVTGFVAAVTRVRAGWFNYVANNFPSIVDGVGGGLYELVGEPLRFVSDTQKFKLNFPAALFPIELLGHVKIGVTDEPNYAAGQGSLTVEVPATFSSTVTYTGAIVYNNTITFNNVVTFASGADPVVQSGCAWTFQNGSSATFASGSSFVTAGLVTMTTTAGSSITIDAASSITLNGTTTLGGAITFPSPHSYTVGPSGLAGVVDADWTPILGGTRYVQVAGSLTAIGWIFDIPAGSVITGVSVLIDPDDVHAGMPASMPELQLHEINPAAGTTVQIDATTDSSANLAAFEPAHTISSPVLNYTVTAGRVIQARVYGENGANSLGNGVYQMPIVTCTRMTLSEL
jgi:hypothetical protein